MTEQSAEYIVEGVILRRIYEKRLEGYTIEAAKEIVKALGLTDQPIQRSSAATEDALGYAQRLATILWEKHWKDDAPEWKPLPDVVGVLTQIDNMVAGLSRDVPQPTPEMVSDLVAGLKYVAEFPINNSQRQHAQQVLGRFASRLSRPQGE